MWIHILIFIIYCVLFFYSKGFFLKAGHVLAGKSPDFLQLKPEQIKLCLYIVFFGNMLGFFVSLSSYFAASTIKDGYLIRNEKGEEAYEETLYVTDGKHKEELDVLVEPETYTKEELERFLERAYLSMDQRILGKNKSFRHVEHPLNLVTELAGTPVFVEWISDQPLMLGFDGSIGEQVPKEGCEVLLRGELTAGDLVRRYERAVTVFPQKLPAQEAFARDIKLLMEELDSKSTEKLFLPKMLNGKPLIWHKSYAKEGGSIAVLAVLISLLLVWKDANQKQEEKKKKEAQMRAEYPLLLNKLILYMRAGMSSRMAIKCMVLAYEEQKNCAQKEAVLKDCLPEEGVLKKKLQSWLRSKKQEHVMCRRYAYEELSYMYYEMEQGILELEAYERFAQRCELMEYRTLANLLTQNVKKGSSQFFETLEMECKQAFENRKKRALLMGEEAGTKLLVPMVLMLLVVLVLILVPSLREL